MDKDDDMILARDKNQLTIIYSEQSSIAKQTLGYVEASKSKVQLINLDQSNLTGSQWAEIAKLLNKSIEELFDGSHPDTAEIVGDNPNMDANSWIKTIQHNPQILQQPILLKGDQAQQISTPSKALEFIGVDSAGLDKHAIGKKPEIAPNSENENMV